MCRAVRCRICGMVTWVGCGDHVDEALAGVPVADRCPGHDPSDKLGGDQLPDGRGFRSGMLGW